MSPAEILDRVHGAGVRLRAEGESIIASPKEAVTAEVIELVRQNKPALLAALARPATHVTDVTLLADDGRERRRQVVLKMLADNPRAPRAVYCDDDTTDPVIVTVAVRGKGSLEVLIPKAKYDGINLLELADKHHDEPRAA